MTMTHKIARRLLLRLVVSVAPLGAPPIFGQAQTALTTAPVDYSLYREGEVQRTERRFAGWLLTCDEIRRLGRKFCSMRTVARAADGTIVAAVTVSTDDRGSPAAIVTLPYGTLLTSGVRISYGEETRNAKKAFGQKFQPTQCSGLGCQVVWPLGAEAIRELRVGKVIKFAFARRTDASFSNLDLASGLTTIDGTIDGKGFAEALATSMR